MGQAKRISGYFPSKETILKYLYYDSESGFFKRNTNTSKSTSKDVAGCINRFGYVMISIENIQYQAHRLAWVCCYSELPKTGVIDHKNRIKTDNRICNLRNVSISENKQNQNIYKNNKTGHRGVHFHERRNKFIASIRVNGVLIWLGQFNDIDDAVSTYKKAAKIYHSCNPINETTI